MMRAVWNFFVSCFVRVPARPTPDAAWLQVYVDGIRVPALDCSDPHDAVSRVVFRTGRVALANVAGDRLDIDTGPQ